MTFRNLDAYEEPSELPDDIRYVMWAQFLRISPSYQLAHRLWCNEATVQDIPANALDFEQVMETYENFGDVFSIRMTDWWDLHSNRLFAPQNSELRWKFHAFMKEGEVVSKADLDISIAEYCDVTRPNQGNPSAILVSIPVNVEVDDCLNSIRAAIRTFRRSNVQTEKSDTRSSHYELLDNGYRMKSMADEIEFVNAVANNPERSQWKVAFDYKLNSFIGRTRKLTRSDQCSFNEIERLSAAGSRMLKKALHAAENAARGKFYEPTPRPEHALAFDFEWLNRLPEPESSRPNDEMFA